MAGQRDTLGSLGFRVRLTLGSVSLAALVRRAFDLGIYTEATYRRAYTILNQRGWRTHEPDEPAMERPTLLARAAALVGPAGYPVRRIAGELRLGEGMLERLLGPARAVSTGSAPG